MRRYAFRGLVLLALASALVYELWVPNRRPLPEAALWGGLVVTSFIGWGTVLKHALFRRARVDAGLLGAWGASVLCFIGGVLGATSLLRRPVLMFLVEAGVVFAAVALIRAKRRHAPKAVLRFARKEPLFALIGAVAAALVLLHYLAAIADWHTNPYDDDIAYLAFVKKLLDTGNFPEPFSLRRLSALGGQTLYLALAAPRTGMSQMNVFDRGICPVLIALLIAGYRSRRAPGLLFRLGAVAFVFVVPSVAINTASYFSGVVFFMALHRTLVFLEDRRELRPWAAAIPLALVSAATCTLRQSFLPFPPIMLGLSYLFLFLRSRQPWMQRLREPLFTAGLTLAALLPWFAMMFQSNRTFLFPIVLGNANPALQFTATGTNFSDELMIAFTAIMDGLPIRTLPVLFVGVALLRDPRARRPTWALAGACIGSFALLVHTFTQCDGLNMGRYVFGFFMALGLVVILEAGAQVRRAPIALGRRTIAGVVALSSVLVEILEIRPRIGRTYVRHLQNIEELAFSVPSHEASRAGDLAQRRLQASVPPGAQMAVLLDEPLYLDYARNPIYNLDMPGFASPAPGLPFFQGPSTLVDYLRGLRVRYVAFVRPEHSRYHYRRDYWIDRLRDPMEFWRTWAPYLLDFIDNLTEIARTHRVLFEERGLVVVDLEETIDAP